MVYKKSFFCFFLVLLLAFVSFVPCNNAKAEEPNKSLDEESGPVSFIKKVGQHLWQWTTNNVWPKIRSWFLPEFEKRKQYLKEGLEGGKEDLKEEVREETLEVTESLWKNYWERLKKLVK